MASVLQRQRQQMKTKRVFLGDWYLGQGCSPAVSLVVVAVVVGAGTATDAVDSAPIGCHDVLSGDEEESVRGLTVILNNTL